VEFVNTYYAEFYHVKSKESENSSTKEFLELKAAAELTSDQDAFLTVNANNIESAQQAYVHQSLDVEEEEKPLNYIKLLTYYKNEFNRSHTLTNHMYLEGSSSKLIFKNCFQNGSYRKRIFERLVKLNLKKEHHKLSESTTHFYQTVKDTDFDSENLSSAVMLDHKAEKVTIILKHKDHLKGNSHLLLELPFGINVLESLP
jgi:hypothetical protein